MKISSLAYPSWNKILPLLNLIRLKLDKSFPSYVVDHELKNGISDKNYIVLILVLFSIFARHLVYSCFVITAKWHSVRHYILAALGLLVISANSPNPFPEWSYATSVNTISSSSSPLWWWMWVFACRCLGLSLTLIEPNLVENFFFLNEGDCGSFNSFLYICVVLDKSWLFIKLITLSETIIFFAKKDFLGFSIGYSLLSSFSSNIGLSSALTLPLEAAAAATSKPIRDGWFNDSLEITFR